MKAKWNWFEIGLLSVSVVAIIGCFVFSVDKNYLSLASSILGVVTVVFTSKGLLLAPVLSVVYSVIYTIISVSQRYYGEAIIYMLIMIPMQVVTIIGWFKNKKQDSDIVEVGKVSKKEYLILGGVTVALTFAFYFLLKWLNTAELVVSTISLITSALATYLVFRRCSYYALFYVLNDIILIVLWTIAMSREGVAFLPVVVSFYVFFINDVYGFIRWKKQEREQLKTIESTLKN
jgi:nicotinamide mononucleotide transporter PnuC